MSRSVVFSRHTAPSQNRIWNASAAFCAPRSWLLSSSSGFARTALLRRELQTRETFAMKEMQLKCMHNRADLIERMILGSNSAEDIAEQVKFLSCTASVHKDGHFNLLSFNFSK
jgi:hypothetical protein